MTNKFIKIFFSERINNKFDLIAYEARLFKKKLDKSKVSYKNSFVFIYEKNVY